ncbi:MAG: hypothetical protein MZV65_52385 [Chromatiales bacterium]|nr:hypothetical protein [Chromatiales bacterium]
MTTKLRALRLAGPLLGGLWCSAPGMADTERGRLLYENHCMSCHESVLHIREKRKAANPAELRAAIERWAAEPQARLAGGRGRGRVPVSQQPLLQVPALTRAEFPRAPDKMTETSTTQRRDAKTQSDSVPESAAGLFPGFPLRPRASALGLSLFQTRMNAAANSKGTLLAIIEIGAYPNFAPLYQKAGYEVVQERAMRKALASVRKLRPAVIVAEFNYQSDFRDRTSSLESLFSVVQTLPGTRVIVFYDAEQTHQFERVRSRFPDPRRTHLPDRPGEAGSGAGLNGRKESRRW